MRQTRDFKNVLLHRLAFSHVIKQLLSVNVELDSALGII